MLLTTTPIVMGWGWGQLQKHFVRNCMKCSDLHNSHASDLNPLGHGEQKGYVQKNSLMGIARNFLITVNHAFNHQSMGAVGSQFENLFVFVFFLLGIA